MTTQIRLVGNPTEERQIVRSHLSREGFTVSELSLRALTEQNKEKAKFDLTIFILPSIGVRDYDLEAWVRTLTATETPLLILSAYSEPEMMVTALNSGADDFLTLPFRRDVFLARVRALLRRSGKPAEAREQRVEVDGLIIDLTARRAFVNGQEIKLTRTEFSLLAELAGRAGAVCTHDELLERVWGCEYWDANHYLHVYLNRIRKKIGVQHSALLETVPGMGYIFRIDAVPSMAVAV